MSVIKHVLIWNRQIRSNINRDRDPHIWIFAEWWGKRCNDNSCALANYVSEEYDNIRCIWITSKTTDTSALSNEIQIVEWKTKEAEEYLRKASVVVVNQNLQDLNDEFDFSCAGAVVINLWHGVPWKRIGLDAVPRKRRLYYLYQKYVLKLQKFTGFACPGKIYEDIYKRAFSLKQNQLLCVGQPRNRLFYNPNLITELSERIRVKLGVDKKASLICYLPTFRDSHTKPFSFTEISDSSFYNWLESNNVYIIQKAHAVEIVGFSGETEHIINITDISAQELMAASDMLITDYSSCFFDYLLLDRPIIHYLYDYDYYKNVDRGLYYDKESITCGSTPETQEDLIKAILDNFETRDLYHNLRMERKAQFMTYERPDNCEIIIQSIFEQLSKRGMML